MKEMAAGYYRPQIAICFFGITRSLKHTLFSIENNVLSAAARHGDTKIYSHFFLQSHIDNPRSGELGSYNLHEYKLLKSDWVELEEPDLCLNQWNFTEVCSVGDFWNDNFRSARNLIHQLHSLRQVTLAVERDEVDTCIFCRPDLIYHDSFGTILNRTSHQRSDHVWLPYWQNHGGFNDRFAICKGRKAIKAYGHRVELVARFCREVGPLHSEKLLKFSLTENKISVHFIGNRASRTRIDGVIKKENFQHPFLSALRKNFGRQKMKTLFMKMLQR